MVYKSHPSSSPLFTVVIATYNYGHLIERAIDSVLAQNFQDFELIVVDDGSTDDTQVRMERYAGRLRYVHKENAGQSSAYNLGADHAKGRYVYILDADDELLPEALGIFAERLDTPRSAPGLYYAGYVSVSAAGAERVRASVVAPQAPKERLRRFLRRQITGLQNCTSIIPREFFERFRYPENLRNNTDIVFFGQLVANFPATRVDAIVAKIHDHPGRTRKQADQIIAIGTAPVDVLFDPALVPPDLMSLKRVYLAQRLRSVARTLYFEGAYKASRNAYASALFSYPPAMLQFSTLKRFALAALKSSPASGERQDLP